MLDVTAWARIDEVVDVHDRAHRMLRLMRASLQESHDSFGSTIMGALSDALEIMLDVNTWKSPNDALFRSRASRVTLLCWVCEQWLRENERWV